MNTLIKKEDVTIKEVNPEAEDLAAAFGISEERRDEICDIVEKDFTHGDNMVQAMSYISSKLENKEELAFTMFIYGVHMTEKQRNPLASLMAALGGRN